MKVLATILLAAATGDPTAVNPDLWELDQHYLDAAGHDRVMLDEPQSLKETYGFATSGWNAVPAGGKIIARIAPMLGIEPRFDLPPAERLILAKGQ